jgi:hypothetical protein
MNTDGPATTEVTQMRREEALEFLEVLWENYHRVAQQVDSELMPPEVLDAHVKQGTLTRPFRIRSWLCRQGYIISAWSLWEYYSRIFCEGLPTRVGNKTRQESCVDWVARSLAANQISFRSRSWFAGANALRNLIAHHSGRAVGPKAKGLLAQAKTAFPDLAIHLDDYLILESEYASAVQFEINDFILHNAHARTGN